jgi:hypothetical protein
MASLGLTPTSSPSWNENGNNNSNSTSGTGNSGHSSRMMTGSRRNRRV